jgi:outer membrane protein
MKAIQFLLTLILLSLGIDLRAQTQPMTLVECVEMAVEKNINIKQSELALNDAEINKDDATGNFFPTLNAQANHTWNVGLNQDITRGLLENKTTQYTSFGASINVDLYNGLRNLNQLHRANLSILAGEYQLEDMKDDVRLMVANAYLQILFNVEIFEKALTHRKDIKLSITNIAIAEKDIELAKGTLQPSLSAFYGYNTRVSYADRITGDGIFSDVPIGFVSSTKDPVLRSVEGNRAIGPIPFGEQFDQNAGHNFGLRVNIPIFNGFVARNRVERSKVNLLRSQNQLEQEKLDLENTINQAYNNAEGAFKFYEAAQKTELARKKAYEDAINRFEAGVMNIFDFNQIKQRFETAASDLVRAKFDYIFKLKVLEFYFGITINL